MTISNTRFERFFAFFLDILFSVTIASVVVWFVAEFKDVRFQVMFFRENLRDTLVFYYGVYFFIASYEIFSLQSLGKSFLKIEISGIGGGVPGVGASFLRWLMKNLPVIVACALQLFAAPGLSLRMIIGCVLISSIGHWTVFLPIQLAIHDALTRTQVVFVRAKPIPSEPFEYQRFKRAANF